MSQTGTLDRSAPPEVQLLKTPLYALHRQLGAKLVPFAGYEMPVQYASGIVKEHNHVRNAAGLFDVSHMGQARISGAAFAAIAGTLERLVPGDILGLKPGQIRYTQLLNEKGGIIDDLMVTRDEDGKSVSLVVNASRKAVDFALIPEALSKTMTFEPEPDRALLALQGPEATRVLSRLFPGVEALGFMTAKAFGPVLVSRSGYTGEDGFEISVRAADAEALARQILAEPEVLPIGLGARDTLRLEAGLPLYGQDMDEATSPVEAGLAFSIGKRRRAQGGFPGASRVLKELAEGPDRLRVGLTLQGRSAARHGMKILDPAGNAAGEITSGAFTPTAAAAIATGYVPAAFRQAGTRLAVEIRGSATPAQVTNLPFVPHRYIRKA